KPVLAHAHADGGPVRRAGTVQRRERGHRRPLIPAPSRHQGCGPAERPGPAAHHAPEVQPAPTKETGMPSGYAWSVRYPRRRGQDYVCLDTERVARDVHRAVAELGWPARVERVAFRGEGGLHALAGVAHLLGVRERLDPGFGDRWRRDGDVLTSDNL